jgi:hypothetical protein
MNVRYDPVPLGVLRDLDETFTGTIDGIGRAHGISEQTSGVAGAPATTEQPATDRGATWPKFTG